MNGATSDDEHDDVDRVDAMLSMLLEEDSPRSIAESEVWGSSVLVQAWGAAMSEFKAYAAAAPGLPATLDREQQLMASPLWYAPPPLPKAASASKKRSYDTAMNEHAGQDADEDEEADEYQDEAADGLEEEVIVEKKEIGAGTTPDEQEGEPYFNINEYEPVSPAPYEDETVLEDSERDNLPFPEPPPIEEALPQDSALLASETPQEALQKALNAWYTAGYAAALYHVKSGIVPP